MRIAYLAHWNEGPDSGVFKKICQQTRAWRMAGADVRLYILSSGTSRSQWANWAGVDVEHESYNNLFERWTRVRALTKSITEWGPDVLYYRWDPVHPSVLRLARLIPTVCEINTDDVAEAKLAGRIRLVHNTLLRGKMLSNSRAVVSVSRQLAEGAHLSRHCSRIAVIGNSIELASFPLLRPAESKSINVAFLGYAAQPWSGVDKVHEMASLLPEWVFHLIGVEPDEVAALPNIKCYGRQERAQYEPILAKCQIALGTLALHRKSMDETSALKTREYLAYGLPTINSHEDTDFPNGASFLLQLPNEEGNISPFIREIRDFGDAWRHRRVLRADIAHLDTTKKEAERLAFLGGLVEVAKK